MRRVVVGVSLLLLFVGLGAFVVAACMVWIPLSVAPEGHTIQELRELGAAPDPASIAVSGILLVGALTGAVFLVLALVLRRPHALPDLVGVALATLAVELLLAAPLVWGSGFGTADYFGGSRSDPSGALLLAVFFVAVVGAIAVPRIARSH